MSKLAITGITGKNGKYLFQEILSNEIIIEAMFNDGIKFCVRDLNKAKFIKESDTTLKYEFVKGDTSDVTVTDDLLKDCSTVLHIAGIQTSLNIMRSAVKNDVKRVILVHTTGIYSKYKEAGPVFFTQKRVGIHKKYFGLHKFRSMKMSTPHDTPTHLLKNPEQYITKVGSFLRKSSLDELPQIWDIFVGNMSIVGPRPALWNQYDLIAERDKYGANDIMPGLTGWAQINGRDELEIDIKARFDGEYVQKMSFLFDARCFFATFFSVLRAEGVVEGGTGVMKQK